MLVPLEVGFLPGLCTGGLALHATVCEDGINAGDKYVCM